MTKQYTVGIVGIVTVGNPGDFDYKEGVPALPLCCEEKDPARVLFKFWDLKGTPFIGVGNNGTISSSCAEKRIEDFHGSRKGFFESLGFPGLTPVACCAARYTPGWKEVWEAIDPWSVA